MSQTPVRPDHRPTTPERVEPPRRRGGFLRGLALVAATLVGLFLVVVLVIGQMFSQVGDFLGNLNPFATERVDRSQPPLLVSIQDLSQYDAAVGNFQVVIDLQDEGSRLPDFLLNERTLYIAVGSVDASVDFSELGSGAVEVASPESVTITLPEPVLQDPQLDLDASYVYSQERGLLNRLGDVADDDDGQQREIYRLAEDKLTTAADETDLVATAEANTRQMLTGLLGSLGYTDITVDFT